jgi:parallel beta-helix repeat protein
MILFLLMTSILALALKIEPVKADGTIYIRADGRIEPSTAPISTIENITYTFSDNIISNSIVLERNNIVLDGAGFTLQGPGNTLGSGNGILVSCVDNVTIENMSITGFGYENLHIPLIINPPYAGIFLNSSSNDVLLGNNLNGNFHGVSIYSSSENNTVKANNVSGGFIGVCVEPPWDNSKLSPNNNTVSENNVSGNLWTGIYLSYSSNTSLLCNNVSRNSFGIYLSSSPNSVLSKNMICNNTYGLSVSSYGLSGYINSIDTSNLVNGKPAYYYTNEQSLVINPATYPSIGYLALVNCKNADVENMTLTDNGEGVLLANTTDSTVKGNTIATNLDGIVLDSSKNNMLANNMITGGDACVRLISSSNNTLLGNNATGGATLGLSIFLSSNNTISENNVTGQHSFSGIDLDTSPDNRVFGNNVAGYYYGIQLYAPGNIIYHNNFLSNTHQAIANSGSVGIWDDGYPSGGNYWSDYKGTDLYGGPYQNLAGSDGIGDTPYVTDSNNKDRYPLMQPWSGLAVSLDEWPMFRHDPAHDGFSTSHAPRTSQVSWTYTTGKFVDSSPAVVGGIVYSGSEDHNVYALNASTGTLIWNYTTNDIVGSSPAVAYGMVFVSSVIQLYAFNASTGTLAWSQSLNLILSSPTVADNMVFVGSGSDVYALNSSTGAFVWRQSTGSDVVSSPTVAYGMMYVGSDDHNVYAFNASTGNLAWNYTTGSWVESSPAVAYGAVFVGSGDGNVYAFNASTGTLAWNYTTGGSIQLSSPAVADGVVFVGSSDKKIYALNATTGSLLWSYTTGSEVWSSPAVADGVVFVGSFDNNVYALNTSTGTVLWNYTTGKEVDSSPAVAYGMVFVGSLDGKVYAFGPSTRVHDVAVTGVTANRTWVYQGFSVDVNITVLNKGDFDENVTVTLYYNTAANKMIGTQTLTISAGQNETVAFTWDTTGVPYPHNYTITAVATIPADNNPADNTLAGGTIEVRIPGDINGDGRVDILDAIQFGNYFGLRQGDKGWNPDADLNHDGQVNILDMIIVARNFGSLGSS